MSYLNDFRVIFNPVLSSYFDRKEKELNNLHPEGKNMGEVIRSFTTQGGKKFRPALLYSAYESYSKTQTTEVLSLSISLELLHTFALIHDDIIDHSPLRRGVSTIHEQFDKERALLFGDIALVLADEVLSRGLYSLSLSDDMRKRAFACFNALKQEVLVGEYMDYIKHPDVDVIMLYKTAGYSFIRPIELGLILAGVGIQTIKKWKIVAEKVGLLFQKKDDYIGLFGSVEEIGKSVTSDIEEGKNTFIIQMFYANHTKEEKERFDGFFGKGKVKATDFDWFKSLLIKKEIQQKAKNIIQEEAEAVKKILKSFNSSTSLFKLLNEITSKLVFFSTP